MKRTEDGRLEIEFDTTRILKFVNHVAEVSNITATIFHLSHGESINEIPRLETDGLPIAFEDKQGNFNVSADSISEWIFKKAFEDFIVGLTQSLMEGYSLLKLTALADNSIKYAYVDEQTLKNDLANISTQAHKLHFPQLIEAIEDMVGSKLIFKDEVLSINQVRNCLVHKNGVPIGKSELCLKYIQMSMFVRKNSEILPLTKELKREWFIAEQLMVQSDLKEIRYTVGEKIKMTPDVLKDVTYTGILFIHELIKKLPLPEAIKEQIIQPFKINLVTE